MAFLIHRIDIKHDGTGATVATKVIEQFVKVNVGGIAQRDKGRKANTFVISPIEYCCTNGC